MQKNWYCDRYDGAFWFPRAALTKNYFEKDIPAPEDAPIVDGKWTALPKEAMEIAIGIYDINDMADKIMECIGTGSNKEVEAKPEGKNMQATQE